MIQPLLVDQFTEAIGDCRRLYVDKSVECILGKSDLDPGQRAQSLDEIELQFNRLLIKIYVEVAWSDCVWTTGEGQIAKTLVQDLLQEPVHDRNLRETLNQLAKIANRQSWQSVLEPFTQLRELDQYRVELESALMRIANIVAKIDGNVTAETISQLKNVKWQLHQFLAPPPLKQPEVQMDMLAYNDFQKRANGHPNTTITADSAAAVSQANGLVEPEVNNPQPANDDGQADPEQLENAIQELDSLIGIDAVKDDIRRLVNFMKFQAHRRAAGLTENQISRHMVFEGNPGTGKTTVARILSRIFRAMGVLQKGHLIETDRSGLVAEYVGQTAAKTNKRVDEALDGVLFIDEAYSLMSDDGRDAFGAEAIQTLLKRAEDDRDRLIVVLAGYPAPLYRMLKSNPGLSSRFSRQFTFPDYTPQQLVQIFEVLAEKNHYEVSQSVRSRLLEQVELAVKSKDEHFGNGRLMRNIFENAIRRLADRVVDVCDLTPELLTTFIDDDIRLDG